MPTEEENVQYLYLILTNGGAPVIDWDIVGEAMELSKGAVSKRWSRLKKAMEAGETPSGSVYRFLWLCVKHSKRDAPMDWKDIAEKCGTTSGAASKRYSRMKQAFENGDAAPGGGSNPGSPVKNTPAKGKATPRKKKGAAASDDDTTSAATPIAKRKRAAPKKAESEEVEDDMEEDTKIKVDSEAEDVDVEAAPTKKAKVAKPKAAAKPKATPKPKAAPKAKVKTEERDIPMSTIEDSAVVRDEPVGEDVDDSVERVQDWLQESA